MGWQLMIWGAGAGTAVALVLAYRPATFVIRRAPSVPRTVPLAAGALAGLVIVGVAITGAAGLPSWARACWTMATASLAGWIAWHGRGPSAWGPLDAAGHPASSEGTDPAADHAGAEISLPAGGTAAASIGGSRPDAPGRPTARVTRTPTPAPTPMPTDSGDRTSRMSRSLADQDDLVQSLTIASYALQLGDTRRAYQAVEVALGRSRATLDRLLRENGGGLVRGEPAVGSGPTASGDAAETMPTGYQPTGHQPTGFQAPEYQPTRYQAGGTTAA